MDLNATTRSHRHFHSATTFRKVNHKVHKSKALALPNKTRSNCWLATIRFCMASKQQRRAIKTFRGSILIRDQSLTGNDIKHCKKKRLGIYFRWLTFVVTQIISMSQVRTLLRKQKNSWLQNFQFFCKHQTKFFGVVRTSPKPQLPSKSCQNKDETKRQLGYICYLEIVGSVSERRLNAAGVLRPKRWTKRGTNSRPTLCRKTIIR